MHAETINALAGQAATKQRRDAPRFHGSRADRREIAGRDTRLV